MASVIQFDAALFRAQCPAYANETTYPDALIEGYWDMAIEFVSDQNCGRLTGNGRRMAINWMPAHLIYLAGLIAAGQIPQLVQSSSIDVVSVTLTPPPVQNQFRWWLSLTPYGQQLLALLQVRAAGGFFVGGSVVRSAFRNA